ncbi:uncharacterized protein LOC119021272 [Xyrichtys novacula]|nr:uncharacterized protein LOC119021272 [Xyrichtys novacula]
MAKLLYVPMMVLLMTNSGLASPPTAAPWITTTGPSGTNLGGKMITSKRGISLYSPNLTPPSTSQPVSSNYNHSYNTAQPNTIKPTNSTRGVSVCLRLTFDYRDTPFTLFTLSPSSSPLALRMYDSGRFILSHDVYGRTNIYLVPDIKLWTTSSPEVWTRICVTVDSEKNVAQMFSDFNMSIRKMLYAQYVWSGEPVIDIPGFSGQVTDLQVWDYPLSYQEVYSYMISGVYLSPPGNVLTWSSISYSFRGNALLEDIYEEQAKQPSSSRRGTGRCRKAGKETKKPVTGGKNKE